MCPSCTRGDKHLTTKTCGTHFFQRLIRSVKKTDVEKRGNGKEQPIHNSDSMGNVIINP
jgi:hypothetical protein